MQRTSISNLMFNLRSGSWCSSASRFIRPVVQEQGGLNTFDLAADSRTFTTNGTMWSSSCCFSLCLLWKASMIRCCRLRCCDRIDLSLAKSIRPSQWPRFFSRDFEIWDLGPLKNSLIFLYVSLTTLSNMSSDLSTSRKDAYRVWKFGSILALFIR